MPPRDFAVPASELHIDNALEKNVRLEASYDRHMRLSFRYFGVLRPESFGAAQQKIWMSGHNFPEDVSLIATLKRITSDGTFEMRMASKTEPFLMRQRDDATHVNAVVINGPEIYLGEQHLLFEHDGFQINYEEFPKTEELREQKKGLRKDCIATGILKVSRTDKSIIEPNAALRAISHLARYLRFVRGGNCGIGHMVGLNKSEEIAFTYLGFQPCDQFHLSTGWHDLTTGGCLSEVYRLYSDAVRVEADTFVILRAIAFYRASNVTRDSDLEMALVAGHTALETLVPHLLLTRFGWSNSKLQDKAFHDKLRAVVGLVGLLGDPFEHLPEIGNRALLESCRDAYELLSRFRNRIVHPGDGFKYTGVELTEVWNFSLWLCEVLIFFYIGYRGKMNDRRKYNGWRGGAVAVPLPKTD